MAPEQALATAVDRRADIFSMGLIFWELVVGERVWGDLSDVQILQRLTFGELPQLRERWPGAPEALVHICSRALAMAPDDRYESAAQMRDDVEAYLATLGRRPTSAEIGRLLAETFAHQRAEVRSAISEQLGRLHAAPVEEEVEEFEILPVIEDRSVVPWSQRMPVSHRLSAPVPEIPPQEDERSPDSISTRKTIPTLTVANAQLARRRALWSAGIGAGLLVVAGGVWAVASLPWSKEPERNEEEREMEPPPPPPINNLIELHIIATPPDAKIYLDDIDVGKNPFFARFHRDGTGHRVRVMADGYEPEARFVVFVRDESLTINLRPRPTPVPVRQPGKPGGGTPP
jgi:serine/threonine-protein kinase